jgi:hypothetical protein
MLPFGKRAVILNRKDKHFSRRNSDRGEGKEHAARRALRDAQRWLALVVVDRADTRFLVRKEGCYPVHASAFKKTID